MSGENKQTNKQITQACIPGAVEAFLARGGQIDTVDGVTPSPRPMRSTVIDPSTQLVRRPVSEPRVVSEPDDDVVARSLLKRAQLGDSRDAACRALRVGVTRAQRIIKKHGINFRDCSPKSRQQQ